MDNLVEFLYSKFLQSDGVSIDTRTLKPENLFFGIKGPNFDGGKFAEKAIEKGATFAVVQDEKYATSDRVIVVPDAQKALQELAIFHRGRFNKKRIVFGLTGSNGKTTTKELISRVLAKKFIIHATEGNYNNHLGVPLTMLHIHPQVEIAIVEMGANRVGDIAELCSYANPTHGLITNIGYAHTETFGGIEGVLRGKTELYDYLKKNEGVVFINALDERLVHLQKRFDRPIVYPDNDLNLKESAPFLKVSLGYDTVETKLTGKYNFSNIAAAVAVGRYFEVDDKDILEALKSYTPDNWRSQLITRGSVTILLDAYNANPTSMKGAIENLGAFSNEKIAIIGGMEEVEDSERAHKVISDWLTENKIDRAMLLGERTKIIADVFKKSEWFSTKEELEKYLKNQQLENCTVLIKASRAAKLETIAELL